MTAEAERHEDRPERRPYAKVRSIRPVVRDGWYNAWTDLIYWKEYFWLAHFRGLSHGLARNTSGRIAGKHADRLQHDERANAVIDGATRDSVSRQVHHALGHDHGVTDSDAQLADFVLGRCAHVDPQLLGLRSLRAVLEVHEVDRFLADIIGLLDGQAPAAIVGDRFRHAEFIEALRGAGLDRAPCVWRGMGMRDGSEDVERFRRALFEGKIKTLPSLLLRSAFADAITIVDPAGNHKLAKGRSTGRIDAAAATVLAVAQGVRMTATPRNKGRITWG